MLASKFIEQLQAEIEKWGDGPIMIRGEDNKYFISFLCQDSPELLITDYGSLNIHTVFCETFSTYFERDDHCFSPPGKTPMRPKLFCGCCKESEDGMLYNTLAEVWVCSYCRSCMHPKFLVGQPWLSHEEVIHRYGDHDAHIAQIKRNAVRAAFAEMGKMTNEELLSPSPDKGDRWVKILEGSGFTFLGGRRDEEGT